MDEATPSLPQTPTPNHAQRQAMARGVRVLAQQRAIAEVKRRLQRKGVKLQPVPYREIVALAEEIVLADAQYRG